jgi:hypothetical protein
LSTSLSREAGLRAERLASGAEGVQKDERPVAVGSKRSKATNFCRKRNAAD